MKLPSRIKKMSRRRQKIAILSFISKRIEESLKPLIGRPFSECYDDIYSTVENELQRLSGPRIDITASALEGGLLRVDAKVLP